MPLGKKNASHPGWGMVRFFEVCPQGHYRGSGYSWITIGVLIGQQGGIMGFVCEYSVNTLGVL